MQPLVTIIAVCYNQEKWVTETLNSINNQNYKNIQLIIADDGSSDNSKEIIQSWINEHDPTTIFISHKKNLGLTKNINSAITFIKGEYFQVFGCDDIMMPDKIERQIKLLQENKDVDIVYADMQMIDINGNDCCYSYYQKHLYKKPLSGNIYNELIDRFIIAAPSVLIRSKVLNELKGYNESLDYEDHDFFLRAAKRHNFLYMPEIVVLYRVSDTSLSSEEKSDLKFLKNSFIIYYKNFDSEKKVKKKFVGKLLFYMKNLYALKFRYSSCYFFKAFMRTGNFQFLKYSIASLPFYLSGNM